MNRKEKIKQRLDVLNPQKLEIIDQTELHRGHKGVDDSAQETHLLIRISATGLEGKSIVEKHRLIKRILCEEFKEGLHALSIKLL